MLVRGYFLMDFMRNYILILGIFLFFCVTSTGIAEAYEIIYPILDYKHTHIPNYCILRPSDSKLNDGQKDWMAQYGEDAVKEWQSTLQKSFGNIAGWQMMSTKINDISEINSKNCDWTISFKPEIESFFVLGAVLGYADTEKHEIVITYLKQDPEEFHDILLHEIGHSLGLGHFVTDDATLFSKWLTSESPPSIMIPNIHVNPGLTYITDVDIKKIESIYGKSGFLKGGVNDSEEFVESKPAINALENLSVSPQTITVKKYQNSFASITGQLKKDFVLSGVPVYLIITKSDLTSFVLTLYPTSKGLFQTMINFDEHSSKGEYSIEQVYRDRTISYNKIKFSVLDEYGKQNILPLSTEKAKSVPDWVKNNAKWWSENLIDDTSFIKSTEYLLQNGIIKVPNLSAKTSQSSSEIPSWVKNNAGWWASGKITDDDFLNGIEYLVNQGIITVKNPK